MLSGFNTNFRHRGVLFHVQTEDSGLENPHVITHLFHGGNIMASEKRDYSDLMMTMSGSELDTAIRKLMQGLHKSMLKRLSRGEHDAAIEQRMGPDVFRAAAEHTPAEPSSVTEEQPPPGPPSMVEDEPPPCSASVPEDESRPSPLFVDEPPSLPPQRAEPAPRRASSLSRVFGDRIVSEKPLDEVVLDYLVENARKKRKRPGPR